MGAPVNQQFSENYCQYCTPQCTFSGMGTFLVVMLVILGLLSMVQAVMREAGVLPNRRERRVEDIKRAIREVRD